MNRRLLGALVLSTALALVCRGALPARAAAPLRAGRGALVVRLRDGVSADVTALSGLPFVRVDGVMPVLGRVVVRVTHGTAQEARRRLLRDPRVAAVDGDPAIHASIAPNDQEFTRQWALQAIQAPLAWELTRGSASVTVAVLDSGIDLSHPDLAANILPGGCNLIADGACLPPSQATPPQDSDGHGTEVAGIIAAVTDNGRGIAGVAWTAGILPVRVLQNGNGVESDFVTGLLWAVGRGATVINLSFNEACGGAESSTLRDALSYAWSHGAVLVAASGNDGGCTQGTYPAADPHVLAVAATDMDDNPTSVTNGGPWVRAAAPGQAITTTTIHGQYITVGGTSFAAPYVAGLAALLASVPGATNSNIVSWITSTCDVPAGWNGGLYGCGRINAYRAVTLAVNGYDPHTSPTAPVTLHLAHGWNNIFYLGPPRRVSTALTDISGKYGSVYRWDPLAAHYSAYLPGQPAASDIQIMVPRTAYWIYMNSAADLVVRPTGNDPPPQLTLSPGWNNVALPAGTLPAPLASISQPVAAVWVWNQSVPSWSGYFVGADAVSDLRALQPDTAYWLYAPTQLEVRYSP